MKKYASAGTALFFVAASIAVVYVIINSIRLTSLFDGDGRYGMPVVVLLSIFGLIIVLTLVVIVLRLFDALDDKQPFALPEGSIRAIMALSLIALFGVVGLYLYGDLAHGYIRATPLVGPEDLASIQKDLGNKFEYALPVRDKKGTLQGYYIYHQKPSNDSSADFAKQMFTAMLTLLSSTIAFYFGTRSGSPFSSGIVGVSSGILSPTINSVLTGKPVVTSVTRTSLVDSQSLLQLTGTNLDKVDQVGLVTTNSHVRITLSKPLSSTLITGTADLTGVSGNCDLVGQSTAGEPFQLAKALTI